jgi:DNA-directed RNA polymerase specialized sigma24 family protein
MQTPVSDGPCIAEAAATYELDLVEELRQLLLSYGIKPEELEETLKEVQESAVMNDLEKSSQELRPVLIRLVLWKLFGGKESLWIHLETNAGNKVPTEVLIEAYFMWSKALRLAERCGVDPAAAADAMAKATHATTDQKAKNEHGLRTKPIRDVRRYLFASFIHTIHSIASKQGIYKTDQMDLADWIGERHRSDKGAFADILDCGIMFKEFLDALDPDTKNIALARYSLGYSWVETAEFTGIPIRAAQRALSIAIQKALGVCMRELQSIGCAQESPAIKKIKR